MNAHLFFPENDLALALDLEHYTAPPAAVRLRRAGQPLPLWYGADGDCFVASGVNASWLDGVRNTFGIDIDVFDYRPGAWAPAPWGWSKASRLVFRNLGFSADRLPDDDALDAVRLLSHRRTAARVAEELKARTGIGTAAVEIFSISELLDYLSTTPDAVVKLPWSSSGRGLVALRCEPAEGQISQIEGMIRRQGSVMAEPRYDKTLDFAMLFTMEGGRCRPAGLSVFETSGIGIYTANILVPQQELADMVAQKTGREAFDTVAAALPGILEDVIGTAYDGPLGVDMLATSDGEIVPVVELNLRMTMGHLCARFYDRFVSPGAVGRFAVGAGRADDSFEARNCRISAGHLNLVPPGGAFTFAVDLR